MSVIEDFIPERPQVLFDRKLRRAIFFGEHFGHVCGDSLDTETEAAIRAVAVQFPNVQFESVLVARQELERELDGTHGRIRAAEIDEICKRNGWT